VLTAEILVQTVQQELEQTEASEAQGRQQSFEALRVQAQTSQTNTQNALDWADRILRASTRFRQESDFVRAQIGSSDKIGKNNLKRLTEELVRQYVGVPGLVYGAGEAEVLAYAQQQLGFFRQVREIIRSLDSLIRQTNVTTLFSLVDRNTYTAEAEAFAAKLDASLSGLESAIQSAKSQAERTNLSVISSANRVKTAEASLALARANADSQIASAENALRTSANNRDDLEILASVAGKIVAKKINNGDRVNIGESLFSILSDSEEVKVKVFLTREEFAQIQNGAETLVELPDGSVFPADTSRLSVQVDSASRKLEAEFLIPDLPTNFVGGDFVEVVIREQKRNGMFVPLSAVLFEGDREEIFVLGTENIITRKTIQTGEIMADAVVVLSGLEAGDQVVRYRNQVFSGEAVTPFTQ
jgi:RND family efflux transporter MFP subunit